MGGVSRADEIFHDAKQLKFEKLVQIRTHRRDLAGANWTLTEKELAMPDGKSLETSTRTGVRTGAKLDRAN